MKKLLSTVLSLIIAMQGMAIVHGADGTLIYKQYTADDTGYTALVSNGSPTGATLSTESVSGKTYLKVPATIASENVMLYTAAMYSGRIASGEKKRIDVSFKKEDGIVSGVRFYTNTFAPNGNPKNYYQLSFGTDKAWSVIKMETATKTVIQESTVSDELNAGEYNLCIVYDEDEITWRIENPGGDVKAGTNTIEEAWNNITVSAPFTAAESSFALIGANGSSGECAMYTNLNVYNPAGDLPSSTPGTPVTPPVTPPASTWVYEYTDDFTGSAYNSYSKDVPGEEFGPWKTNGKRSGQLPALSAELMLTDRTYNGVAKTALCIPATALFSSPELFTTADFGQDIPSGGKMEFEFAFYKHGEMVDGIRFMMHNNSSNYYEFSFNRSGNTAPAWTLVKAVDGVRTQLAAGAQGLISGGDYKVKLTYDYVDYCGKITWEVKKYDGSAAGFTGAIGNVEDISPFKHLGTSKFALIGGGQNTRYSYFTDVAIRAGASKEEPAFNSADPAIVNMYITRHNQLISPYNVAVSTSDVAAMKEFLAGNDRLSFGRMELINVPAIAAMDGPALTAFAERLITYGDTISFTDIDDIAVFQKRLETEVAVGNLCNVSNAEIMGINIDNATTYIDIDTATNSYLSMKNEVIDELMNSTFTSASDFKTKFNEAVIMENYQYTINGDYLIGILEEYATEIGYNTAHYDTIDKAGLAALLVDANTKAAITNVTALKDQIDTYNVAAPIPTPTPAPVPAPNQKPATGGGGGGGYGVIRDIPKQTEAPENVITQPIAGKVEIYYDVPVDYWAYEAVRFMNARKAISGYGDGSFRPEGQVTRAEFLTMLLGIYGIEKPESYPEGLTFVDVEEGQWYYDTIMTAASIGILSGDGGYAYPDKLITRQEMAALICRILEYKGIELNTSSELSRFNDDNQIDGWAFPSVKKLQAAGVANGSDGYYMPKASAKRAEAAQMLYKAANVNLKEEIVEEVAADEA